MKSPFLLLALLSLVLAGSAETISIKNHGRAPLSLSINGGGQVLRVHDGQMLEVNHAYTMVGVPDRGHSFIGWTRVEIFTFVESGLDESGNYLTTTNVVISAGPNPELHRKPVLMFMMPPEETIVTDLNPADLMTVTQSYGWVANFSE